MKHGSRVAASPGWFSQRLFGRGLSRQSRPGASALGSGTARQAAARQSRIGKASIGWFGHRNTGLVGASHGSLVIARELWSRQRSSGRVTSRQSRRRSSSPVLSRLVAASLGSRVRACHVRVSPVRSSLVESSHGSYAVASLVSASRGLAGLGSAGLGGLVRSSHVFARPVLARQSRIGGPRQRRGMSRHASQLKSRRGVQRLSKSRQASR